MKICWDNLDNIYLSNRGNFRRNGHTYIYKEKCEFCGESYLTLMGNQSNFCSIRCSEIVNLVDEKFGQLKVIEFVYVRNHKSFWRCRCDCGNKCIISNRDLLTGNTKSCGCLRIKYKSEEDLRRSKSEATKRHYYKDHEKSKAYHGMKVAERRAMKLNQTPDNANLQKIQLYYSICAYLNEPCEVPMWHVDHIQPLSKGGLHHEDNLQILTAAINLQKSDKWPLTDKEQIIYKGVII